MRPHGRKSHPADRHRRPHTGSHHAGARAWQQCRPNGATVVVVADGATVVVVVVVVTVQPEGVAVRPWMTHR